MILESTCAQRRFVAAVSGTAVLALGGFTVAEMTRTPFLSADVWTSGTAPAWLAAVGVALLLADVVLPVPSSVVMIFLGSALGFPAAAATSWLAGTGSALLGYVIGRRLGRRASPPAAMARRLSTHAVLTIALTRPLPILAETVAVAAGMLPGMTWRRVTAGAMLGSVPPAILFSLAGASAHDRTGMLLIPGCILLNGVVWAVERAYHGRAAATA
ncbi:VTT domain-containing protein [Pilimelia columellifera]|uniref:VTT domain-containing protein n=1 Tax=Pilimelia columellifera subsp. columellifera TaxID=706583 RepID=A0ABN3NRF9_9ACTN